jgi:mannan endo-1,4-beta-mannosidase
MWAHTTTSLYPFQTAPGVYDERGLKALDFVLETARKYGLQVILSLIDNWKYYNGVDQYMDWSKTAPKRTMKPPFQDLSGDPNPGDYGTGPQGELVKKYEVERHALFFKDADAKAIYKNNAKFLINRVNTINGRTYRDDPTIIAWNLINEPRCETWLKPLNNDCPARMQVQGRAGGRGLGRPAAGGGARNSSPAGCCRSCHGLLRPMQQRDGSAPCGA